MGDTVVIDELLCYISSKLNLLTCDTLVSLCINGFTDAAIVASKLCLFNACNRGPSDPVPTVGIKYQKRRGDMRMENDVRDIITLFQEMGARAPKYAAIDLNILPSPNVENVDVPSLLQAIELLRKDVSALVAVVATQQDCIMALQKTIAEKPKQTMTYAATAAPISTTAENVASSGVDNTHSMQSRNPKREREKPPVPAKKKRPFNVGQKAPSDGTTNQKLLGVKRVKTAELFVTRFSKECDTDTIQAYILSNLNLHATVEKIDNSSRNANFSSFHISCVCDDPKVFYDPKLWPEYVLYRRWYPPRRPRLIPSDGAAAHNEHV